MKRKKIMKKKKKEEKRRLRGMMWHVVLSSVLMCLDLTWCDSLCLGSVLMYLNQIWCDPLCWCDLIIVKKLKDSKNLKVPKSSLKLQEVCCLRKKNS